MSFRSNKDSQEEVKEEREFVLYSTAKCSKKNQSNVKVDMSHRFELSHCSLENFQLIHDDVSLIDKQAREEDTHYSDFEIEEADIVLDSN